MMSTMKTPSIIRITVGEAIVRFLDNQFLSVDGQEVKFVSGVLAIYGHGNVLGLGEALTNYKHNLKVIQGRNEQGMGHVAMAYAKQNLNQKIYAVTSSVGPGAANMVTAAATATANHIPVLFLPGDIYATRQPDPVLQQIEFSQDLNIVTNDAFKAVSRFWDRINRPEQLATSLLTAFQTLTNPVTAGAVTIALPQDVQAELYDFPVKLFEKRVWNPTRYIPDIQTLSEARDIIKSSKQPLFIIGGGASYSQAGELVTSLAAKHNIPFATTQAGKGCVLSSELNNLGGIGVTGTAMANQIAQRADCIIGLGTRYTDFTTGSKTQFNPNAKFINININNFDAHKMEGLALVGDVRETLQQLFNADLNKYQTTWQNAIQQAKSQWLKALTAYDDKFISIINDCTAKTIADYQKIYPNYLSHTVAFQMVQKMIHKHHPDAIVVGASGSLPADLQRLWEVTHQNTYHVEYGYSCMGYEVAAGLGAKLACPKQEVFVFVGDGAFLMLHSELLTSLQECMKINILLFDNSGYGCIDNLQTSNGIVSNSNMFRYRQNAADNFTNGELMKVDYAQIATGYGCEAHRATNKQELETGLVAIMKSTKSTLLDIKVLPKTMTKGYDTWWRVGLSQRIDASEALQEAQQEQLTMLGQANKY